MRVLFPELSHYNIQMFSFTLTKNANHTKTQENMVFSNEQDK